MNSRQTILTALGSSPAARPEPPSWKDSWPNSDDLIAQFSSALTSVGGQCLTVPDESVLVEALRSEAGFDPNRPFCTDVDTLRSRDQTVIRRPHDLMNFDASIVRGHFGVAENGAVWLTDKTLRFRSALFAVEHLILVLAKTDLVGNMHQAYDKLHPDEFKFGVFISGPSKTADIEQSLVIGAQGPRRHTVVLVG